MFTYKYIRSLSPKFDEMCIPDELAFGGIEGQWPDCRLDFRSRFINGQIIYIKL